MNCPWCGNEMKHGILIVDGRTHPIWQADDQTYGKFERTFGIDGKEVQGIQHSAWGRTKIDAHYCPDCKKFIFDGWVDKW